MSILTLTKNNFDNEVLTSTQPVLVDFWASWCGPCRMFSPIIDEVADANSEKIKVGKVNIDEEPELAQRFGVMTIPTLLVFKDGTVVNKSIGVKSKEDVETMF